jgi:predicted DNA-binding transcriptional regulator AlpA
MERKMVLLNEKQAAALLGLSPKTLQSWRVRGCGPVFRKIGRLCRYLETDLLDYVQGQVRRSTSEAEATS